MLSWSAREQVHALGVAQALPGQLVAALGHDEHVLALGEAGEDADGRPGRGHVAVEQAGDDVDAAVARPVGEGAAQGGGLHLLGRALGVASAASGRGRRHRRRTAARAWSPAGPGRCPSGGRACAPPPRTSPRLLVECVPWRAAASWATTTWWISGTLTWTSKIVGRAASTVPSVLAVEPMQRRPRGRRLDGLDALGACRCSLVGSLRGGALGGRADQHERRPWGRGRRP